MNLTRPQDLTASLQQIQEMKNMSNDIGEKASAKFKM